MLCPWICLGTGVEYEFRFTKATHKVLLYSKVCVFFYIGGAVSHFKSIFERNSIHFHVGDHNRLHNLKEFCYLLFDYRAGKIPRNHQNQDVNWLILRMKGAFVGCVLLPERGSIFKHSFRLRGPLIFVEILEVSLFHYFFFHSKHLIVQQGLSRLHDKHFSFLVSLLF